MDVSAATPRVNAAMLPGLVGRKVLLVGRVRERRGGDTARAFFFSSIARGSALCPPRSPRLPALPHVLGVAGGRVRACGV
jgi:hypothetical protein